MEEDRPGEERENTEEVRKEAREVARETLRAPQDVLESKRGIEKREGDKVLVTVCAGKVGGGSH